jgi:nicotinamidase-related amidase
MEHAAGHSFSGLRFGNIGPSAVHLCVDMQRLFRDDTPWKTPWMERVLPLVLEIARRKPDRTVFTRFITAEHPGAGPGVWARYWTRWADMTRERVQAELLNLVPDLAELCPPARIVDKSVYSPWRTPELSELLQARGCDTLIITGGETDVCVLATVLGAVDRGFRVIVVADALCGSADETHDAVMTVYQSRYSQQIETVSTQDLVDAWA